jgi:HAD superfamily hydrolase (TIGR01509 family)
VKSAVLFDLDGVLVDSYEVWFRLVNAAARDLGYPAIPREKFHETWGQGVQTDVKVFFVRHTVDEIERYYNDYFAEHARHVKVDPQAEAVFAGLRGRGASIAVITNTPSPAARLLLEMARVDPDVLVGGTDVPRGKPAPDMVLRAVELLGTTVERSVVVGDSRFDRDAAGTAGVRFIGFGIDGDERIDDLSALLDLPL